MSKLFTIVEIANNYNNMNYNFLIVKKKHLKLNTLPAFLSICPINFYLLSSIHVFSLLVPFSSFPSPLPYLAFFFASLPSLAVFLQQ